MTTWIDVSCILIVCLALSILSTNRIVGMIHIFIIQSFILSLVPFFMHADAITGRVLIVGFGSMCLKAVLVPIVLFWAIRHVSMRSEAKPIISIGASIIAGAFLIAVAFWVAVSLKLPGKIASDMISPCALATVLLGFMILITRTQAVTQVIGYLIMENGIFLFALSLLDSMPVLLEMGILLDIFFAVFIMAIVINHINEEFERTSVSLSQTKMGETF